MPRVRGSFFDDLVNHLNILKEGEFVSRKEVSDITFGLSRSTASKWLRQLVVCGYLEKTDQRGVYKRTKEYIPGWLTSSSLEFDAWLVRRGREVRE